MGSFANRLFSLMLGWLQGAFSLLWSAFSADQASSFLRWFAEHWVMISILLCLTGGAADLIIYLLRWRPLKVWKSFAERVRNRKKYRVYAQEPETRTGESQNQENSEELLQQEDRSKRLAAMYEEERLALSHREIAEQSLRSSRRRRFSTEMLTESGERGRISAAPQELFNVQDTYRKPVYPRKWKTNEGQYESKDERD